MSDMEAAIDRVFNCLAAHYKFAPIRDFQVYKRLTDSVKRGEEVF